MSPSRKNALNTVVRFLEKHARFWPDFIGGDREVQLILNYSISQRAEQWDKCFEIYLAPEFLKGLSAQSIGLRVPRWQGFATSKQVRQP